METPNDPKYAEMIELQISPFVQRLMQQKHITGLSIALADNTGILAAKGYGFADKQAKQAVSQHTVFKIGSITKLFTGTAAMQLYERGLLDLDKPVRDYVPEFSIKTRIGNISQITPRTLMTHHSGLQADWYANYWNDDPHAFRQVVEYLKNCALAFPPNTVFSYSNLGMSLMGVIIERISHLSYQEYVEQNILAPLKMNDSALTVDKVAPALLSNAYARDREVEDPILRDAPAGAIFSTAQDMSRFLSMVLGGGRLDGATLLGSKTLNEMLTPQNADVKLDMGFQIGLNWLLGRPTLASAGRVCWHDGGSPHFFSILIALPDLKLGAAVLSNSDGGMINVGLIADEILKRAVEVKTGKSFSPPEVKTANKTKDELKESPTGTFAAANGIVKIFQRKDALRAGMQGMQFSLSYTGEGWYSPRLLLLGFLPIKIASVESLRLAVHTVDGQRVLGMEQYGFRVPFGMEYSPVNIPTAWTESLGEYHLVNEHKLPPFTVMHLKIVEGVLTLQATARKAGKMSLVLCPISGTEATVLGFGRVAGVTVELNNQNGLWKISLLGLEFVRS